MLDSPVSSPVADLASSSGQDVDAEAPEKVRRGKVKRPCTFLHFFNGEAGSYEKFAAAYSIPPDVRVRREASRPNDIQYREGELTFPLMAITKGRVRFPLHPFVRHVLWELTLTSSQLSTNSYRIITSIIELRKREVLNFGIEELFGAY